MRSVRVRRSWSDAGNAWVDVQHYLKLELPPEGAQYQVSFLDKRGIPARMVVTSDDVSWADGLGGGYQKGTILVATIENVESDEQDRIRAIDLSSLSDDGNAVSAGLVLMSNGNGGCEWFDVGGGGGGGY